MQFEHAGDKKLFSFTDENTTSSELFKTMRDHTAKEYGLSLSLVSKVL